MNRAVRYRPMLEKMPDLLFDKKSGTFL